MLEFPNEFSPAIKVLISIRKQPESEKGAAAENWCMTKKLKQGKKLEKDDVYTLFL